MIMDRKFQPVIVFSFSRRECEQYAMSMSKLNFNSDADCEAVTQVFSSAIQVLTEEDRELPQVALILPLLKRGIAVHHSGLLPILKEVIEILFQEGLIKALFATETFAMGLNMPAKTVVFTAMRKWDGDAHRWMSSGEYIQMSGRAGRRGKDERGICIMMIDEQMDATICREMILGRPAPLVSTFRLSYYTLLNLMSRAEGRFDAEHVIEHSFHQFQHEKALPTIEEQVAKLEKEAADIDASSKVRSQEDDMTEYHSLRLELANLEAEMMVHIQRPDRCLKFLLPGRLVKVRDGSDDWGWGVVLNVVRRPLPQGGPTLSHSPAASHYIVDTLLNCAPQKGGAPGKGAKNRPRPCPPGTKGEMHVIPVSLPLLNRISAVRVAVPQDLRPMPARESVQLAVQELQKRFPDGIPLLDPIEDMGIDDDEFAKILQSIEKEEAELIAHPLFKAEREQQQHEAFQRKAELKSEAQRLRLQMKDSQARGYSNHLEALDGAAGAEQLAKFRSELHNRSRVLKKLGHINGEGVVQLKGRAACHIDTADELLITELMFEGAFSELDCHQIVAVVSCFLPVEKSNEQVKLKNELQRPLALLKETARHLAEIQREEKLEIDVEEYVEHFQPVLMDIIYSWSKGAKFAELCEMTDLFEGSIIRAGRRLDELINQMKDAARAIGDTVLPEKFEKGSESIRRGIMFANSLYL
eukprot:SM000280S10717  [mRNA]  locus=s280:13847:18973:+ [translate_table: standard]